MKPEPELPMVARFQSSRWCKIRWQLQELAPGAEAVFTAQQIDTVYTLIKRMNDAYEGTRVLVASERANKLTVRRTV